MIAPARRSNPGNLSPVEMVRENRIDAVREAERRPWRVGVDERLDVGAWSNLHTLTGSLGRWLGRGSAARRGRRARGRDWRGRRRDCWENLFNSRGPAFELRDPPFEPPQGTLGTRLLCPCPRNGVGGALAGSCRMWLPLEP